MENSKYAKLDWYEDEQKYSEFIYNLAPVVLFTYNRLDHTKQTIEALQKNVYASDSIIYIYSDAPKNELAVDKVQAVRNYIHSIDGFKQINIIERDVNWGLANNIIDGVTTIVNKYGKIIVLEDDILTSKYFLKYMNDALEVYKDIDDVMAISGYAYSNKSENENGTYLLSVSSCWGWATWKNVWDLFERNPQKLIVKYDENDIFRFNVNDKFPFWTQVIDNYNGKIYTWGIFFYEIIFRHNGLCLFPDKTMVKNIGFDGSGEHCGKDDMGKMALCDYPIAKFSKKILCDTEQLQAFQKTFNKRKGIKNIIDKIKTFFCKKGNCIINRLRHIIKYLLEKILSKK